MRDLVKTRGARLAPIDLAVLAETLPGKQPAFVRIMLSRFRNYASLTLDLQPCSVVLTGANGAGKTNLLEAVSLMAPGRGLRGASLSEIDQTRPDRETRDQTEGWSVGTRLVTAMGPVELGSGRAIAAVNGAGGERRVVHIDGVAVRGQTALAEHLAITWLTPQMDRLFVEGASGRRRFFDRLVYGFDPDHAGRLARYERAMRERARLLRDGRADPVWLGALEETMTKQAVAVAASRQALAVELTDRLGQGFGPFPAADIVLEGELERAVAIEPALAIEERYRSRLAANRGLDASSGTTAAGIHRTDLAVRHRTKDRAAVHCSTGEQKALLISIQLAFAERIRAARGCPPVLLLDEIAAHLDGPRRAALFDALEEIGGQAWLTGTDT